MDLWLARYAEPGVAGLLDRPRGAGHEQVPGADPVPAAGAVAAESTAGDGIVALVESELARYVSRTTGQMTRLRVTEFAFVSRQPVVGWDGRTCGRRPGRGRGSSPA